jgi:hypothetical protein
MATEVRKIMSKAVAMIRAANQTMRAWHSADLSKHDRLLELLGTYHCVEVENNENYAEKLTWCLEHCKSKFRDLRHGDGMKWYFENEQDATMFALKWL